MTEETPKYAATCDVCPAWKELEDDRGVACEVCFIAGAGIMPVSCTGTAEECERHTGPPDWWMKRWEAQVK